MTVWAYARVSTRDQNPQLQLDALAASGYDELVPSPGLVEELQPKGREPVPDGVAVPLAGHEPGGAQE